MSPRLVVCSVTVLPPATVILPEVESPVPAVSDTVVALALMVPILSVPPTSTVNVFVPKVNV